MVLCGRLVAAAFGLSLDRSVPWTEEQDGVRFLVLPHPSGVSHFWNDEESWHRAALVFRSALRVAGLPCQVGLTEATSPRESEGADQADETENAKACFSGTLRAGPVRSKFFQADETSSNG